MTEKRKYYGVSPDEITPRETYLNRKSFLKLMGIGGLAATLAACAPKATATPAAATATTGIPSPTPIPPKFDELGDPANSFADISHYNNYYEFSLDKKVVAERATGFDMKPWSVEIGGLVNNPQKFTIEDILSKFEQEERVYRLRCVEAWSMVIPWTGFQLSKLLEEVEPDPNAKYVRFETVYRPSQMELQKTDVFPWPYTEGLTIDEAMNELVLLGTGLYDEPLPAQNGGPIRLIVPWKYGFKSIKSIVKIDFVEEEPPTMWKTIAPQEYGFYANVNPNVDHPRWTQATERRIGELGRRPTLMYNGYEEQVSYLYEGLDLVENY